MNLRIHYVRNIDRNTKKMMIVYRRRHPQADWTDFIRIKRRRKEWICVAEMVQIEIVSLYRYLENNNQELLLEVKMKSVICGKT